MPKYVRVHKQVEDSHTEYHICEVSKEAPASHYTDGTIPALLALWKVFEVSDTFVEDNPPSTTAQLDLEDPEAGDKWLNADDGKWYEIKRPCHHSQLYNIDTGEVSCHYAQHSENLETEIV